MNYRSVSDLAATIRSSIHRLPPDVDLVVGIPRSGMLAANLIALYLNTRLTDLSGWLGNVPLPDANVCAVRNGAMKLPHAARHVLLVDDSIQTGGSMARAYAQATNACPDARITRCAIYAHDQSAHLADVSLEHVPMPRVFEWNLMHRLMLKDCCVDIDGVLCVDPTHAQNDDADGYRKFLSEASPLCIPSYPIGHLVTSRLERYRQPTIEWLNRHGIRFEVLHMLDLPTAEARRSANAHASFKAQVYRKIAKSVLFIESNRRQSLEIAERSGKPVLCYSTQEFFSPPLSIPLVTHTMRSGLPRAFRKLVRALKSRITQ